LEAKQKLSRTWITAGLVAALAGESPAQTIDDLRAPESPAFTVLGSSPSSINRPQSARAFAATLINSSASNSDGPLSDFAIEATPYWWTDRDLTYEEYSSPTTLQSVLQTTSFSLASQRREEDGMSSSTLAAGLRTQLLGGDLPSRGQRLAASIRTKSEELARTVNSLRDANTSDSERARLQAEEEELKSSIERDRLELKSLDPVGWSLELAAGGAARVPESGEEETDWLRHSAWLTAAYRPDDSQFDFAAVARFSNDDADGNLVDTGVRALWTPDSRRLRLSCEYLYRWADEGNDTRRYGGVVEYQVNNEYSLVASFGSNFDSELEGGGSIALLGVRLALGSGRLNPGTE